MATFQINSKTAQATALDTDAIAMQTALNVTKYVTPVVLWNYILAKILANTGIILWCHPIGESYTQHYGDPLPSALYGGTWTLRFNDDACVEMTESASGATWEAETFDASVKDSQMQGHYHFWEDISQSQRTTNATTTGLGQTNVTNDIGGGIQQYINGISEAITDGTHGTPRVGLATKPRRRIVRKFTRTA